MQTRTKSKGLTFLKLRERAPHNNRQTLMAVATSGCRVVRDKWMVVVRASVVVSQLHETAICYDVFGPC